MGRIGQADRRLAPIELGRRYSPLLVLAAVQLLLVVLSPSTPSRLVNGVAAGPGGGGNQLAAGGGAANGSNGTTAVGGGAAGTSGGGATGSVSGSAGLTSSGSSGGTSSGGGGGSAGPPVLGLNGGPIQGSTGPLDRSHCDPAGNQVGVTFYMPPCAPVWHGGDNGGPTMTGLDATKVNYVFYVAQGNAEVNAILNTEGLAATPNQYCHAFQAFEMELNKRWEHYGRTFSSMNGPGNHSAFAEEKGNDNCQFPFFQGQCSLTPPDPPCERAEADLIARTMHPAMVLAPVADPAFYNQLGKDGIIVVGGENEPNVYHTNVAPYYWDAFASGTRALATSAEYYCKKLYGKPVQYAGNDVEHPKGPLVPPPIRKAAIVFPATNGDPTSKISADLFVHAITGGMCGSPKDDVKEYPYQSDITTAEQQSTTLTSELKASGVTTVVFYGDPIAPVFGTNNDESQNYHPEYLLTGTGLVDYDVLGQLYNPNVWQHAFGISTLPDGIPFAQTDAVKAANDANGTGAQLDHTENLAWTYYTFMGSAFQLAGPRPTPELIRDGLFNAPPKGGDPTHALAEYGRTCPSNTTDVIQCNDYTGLHDAREVYWCKSAVSPYNNQPGEYVAANGGRRFQEGQITPGNPQVFPNGFC
jgi:hypothetical protein